MKTLRYAVLLDGPSLEAWQLACLEELRSIEGVEPVLVVYHDQQRPSLLRRFWSYLRTGNLFFLLYLKLFVRIPARNTEDLPPWLSDVPGLSCRVRYKGRFSQYFNDDDLQTIRGYRPDFILRFGFNIIRGGILDSAPHGVWSFHHGDERRYRGSPPGFWEIAEGDPLSGAILQRLTNRLDGGVVLRRQTYRTHRLYYRKNLDRILRGSAVMPAQVCRDILSGLECVTQGPPSTSTAPLRYNPNLFQLLVYLSRHLRRLWRRVLDELFLFEEWNIGLVEREIESFVDRPDAAAVNWLPPAPRRHFQADPFGLEHPDLGALVLYERYDRRLGRGGIVVKTLDGFDRSAPSRLVGSSRHHSFPFTIRHQGAFYCLPEDLDGPGPTLYRLDARRWRRVKTLVPGLRAADPVLVYHESHWWLFCVTPDYPEALLVYHAEKLDGFWRPVDNNPVKVDARSARSAGAPFTFDGRLYRPAQDDSGTYGARLRLMRVERLSTTEFRESEAALINPDPLSSYPHGLHTLAPLGCQTLVDGKRMRYTPWKLAYRLARLLNRPSPP